MLSLPLPPVKELAVIPVRDVAHPVGKKNAFYSLIPLLTLLLITLFGGFLRFYRLTFPALWNDESLVYWRVCGTYGQMLEPLRHDMFPPLHYSLYWLIGHCTKLTPWVMRFVPAVAGTLTIPAIYFLSRQLLSKGTSLLAAAFTACSSFMLFYSRDAKMYPHLWLLVTLNVACLLWWFRTEKLTAWLCWIAAGCAVAGLHFSALVVLPLSLIFLLTQNRVNWKQLLWFLLGSVLIVAGPIGYFTKFNPVAERLEAQGWDATGIGWVGNFFNGARTGPQLAQYAASAMLIGYEWPRDEYVPDDLEKASQPISPPLVDGPETASTEIFWILAMAALPWPLFLRARRDCASEPPWRVLLWLGGWILFIGYGFYIPSEEGFASPQGWIDEIQQWTPTWGVAVACALVVVFILISATHHQYRPALWRFVQMMLTVVGLYAGCMVIYQVMFEIVAAATLKGKPMGSVWEPRYLGIVWPAVCIAIAALLMRLPTRAVRMACIGFVLVVNLLMAGMRMVITTEPPIDQLAKDIWDGQGQTARVRTFDFIVSGDIAVAGSAMSPSFHVASGRYYLEMESNHQPISPDIFANSLNFYDRHTDPKFKAVKDTVDAGPQLQKVIIWSELFPHDPSHGGKRQPLAYDPYRIALTGWRLAKEDAYTIHVYWDWRERWTWVRREYVRKKAE